VGGDPHRRDGGAGAGFGGRRRQPPRVAAPSPEIPSGAGRRGGSLSPQAPVREPNGTEGWPESLAQKVDLGFKAGQTMALFSSEKISDFGIVALSFACEKYYSIMD